MRAKASAAKRKKSLNFSMSIASVVLFLCGVLVNTSNALREDQLGTYDWHLKFVGDVRFVSFLTGENDRNKVLVTTQDSNIIAALDQKDGTIEWRATLDESDAVDYASLVSATTHTRDEQKFLLVQSSSGKFIRALDIEDGSMIWETIAYTEAAASEELYLESAKDLGIDILPLGKDVDGDTVHDFLVLAKGTVT